MNKRFRRFIWVVAAALLGVAWLTAAPVMVDAGNRETGRSDAAATTTALVRTREAILLILTLTPSTPTPAASSPAITPTLTAATQLTTTRVVARTGDVAARSPLTLPANISGSPMQPVVEVIVDGLNIRSGPGVAYSIIGGAQSGMHFLITGQAYNCAWINVTDANGNSAWISGAPTYVRFAAPCGDIPPAVIPPTPTARPATPIPTQTPANPRQVGCYVLQNFLGFELAIRLNRVDGWSDTIRIPTGATVEYCAAPGAYTYTVISPVALSSVTGSLVVRAGERFSLPLRLPGQ